MATAADTPHRRAAGLSALLCAVAYLATGVFFFFDPSRNEEPGTPEYWDVLADGAIGRKLFVAAFALTGVFALGAMGAIARRVRADPHGIVHITLMFGALGYAVNVVSYIRVLAGESTRAAAFADGEPATRRAIESFSLVLDTDGWLTFGAVGAFFVTANLAAHRHGYWPRWLAVVGVASGVASWVAMSGLLFGSDMLLSVAAGVGGVVFAPVWWVGIGRLLLRPPPLPSDERTDVEEDGHRAGHSTP